MNIMTYSSQENYDEYYDQTPSNIKGSTNAQTARRT